MTLKQLAERIDVLTNRIEVEFYGKCKDCKKQAARNSPVSVKSAHLSFL
jgi:hypothetical protein